MGNEIIKAGDASCLRNYLLQHAGELKRIAPEDVNFDRMIAIAIASASRSHEIYNCSMISVYRAIKAAFELGLEPGGFSGRSYLVPYNGTCQLIIGYQGYKYLATKGLAHHIESVAVFEGDRYEVTRGLHPDLIHVPAFLYDDYDHLLHVYTIAWMKDGSQIWDTMPKSYIDKRRAMSKSKGIWDQWPIEMALKTGTLNFCKKHDMGARVEKAIEYENEMEEGFMDVDVETGEVVSPRRQSSVEKLKEKYNIRSSPRKDKIASEKTVIESMKKPVQTITNDNVASSDENDVTPPDAKRTASHAKRRSRETASEEAVTPPPINSPFDVEYEDPDHLFDDIPEDDDDDESETP